MLDEELSASFGGDDGKNRKDAKIQTSGKTIVSTLYMLIRNVKIHSPDNKIFLKPIETLRAEVNNVVATDGKLNLHASGTSVFINNTMLKFDFSALENVTFLTKELEARDVGGFSTQRPITSQEIQDFLNLFTGEARGPVNEGGAGGIKLEKLAYVKEIIDKLQQQEFDPNQQVDRKKYLMTVYARSVFFMRKYFEYARKGKPSLPFSKAGRLVQDLVDLCADQRTHFLGLTTTQGGKDYLSFHSVNCALLSIVFGSELGLDRRQLHELGMAALFSQIGLVGIPNKILQKPGSLSQEERELVDLLPIKTAKRILMTRGLDKSSMNRVVATFESKVDYAVPRKGEDGEIELVMPKVNLGIYGKIIAIVETYDALTSARPYREAYGPEIALALMSGDIKYKFDPALLRVFMKVMAIQPIKIMGEGGGKMRFS